jgi:hypothetical protein
MPESIENRAFVLLESLQGKLPSDEFEDIRELIAAGEWGVALENLCQQLYEHDILVDAATLERIRNLAQHMHLPPKTWQFLAT